jgi:hypothetical protein
MDLILRGRSRGLSALRGSTLANLLDTAFVVREPASVSASTR